jgi:hypothetical protein
MLNRAWPTLATLALFALSAAAPGPPRTGPAPPSQADATCDPFSRSGAGSAVFAFNDGSGVRQPLPEAMPVAACSVRATATGWTFANLRVVEWDPLALAPDAQTVALRTAFCDPSDLLYYYNNSLPKLTFVPPIITASLPGVADPPRTEVAFEATGAPNSFYYNFVGYYEPEGDPTMPAAQTFGAAGALSGSHPVTAYALCDGGGTLGDLRIVQSVRRAESVAPLGLDECLQRFRVPEAVEVRWVELAVDYPGLTLLTPVTVGIVDATGLPEPPANLPPALAEAALKTDFYKQPGPRWAAPVDFDHTVELLPGRDYWLSIRTAQACRYRTHALTANESANFTNTIGTFHHRALATDPWTLDASQVLSFKLVGRSLGSPVSVPPRTGFLLSVTPNPARAAAEAVWSGATGPVKLEVFDARGRRVASGSGGAAGRWVIAARGSRPLESGVYFVHARDSEGARAVERLVVVR